MPKSYPDPILSANLYAAGQVDELLAGPMVELLRRLGEIEGFAHLWFMRYPRRGEHLKIRIHGEPTIAPQAEDSLRSVTLPFLDKRPALEDDKRGRPTAAPPIDLEDRAEDFYPDRQLLITRYQRSHVVLGGQPFLSDDLYVTTITRCLGTGCERLLQEIAQQGSDGWFPHKTRQSLLLRALTEGVAALHGDRGTI